MKVAIIYSSQHQKLDQTARALGRTLETQGHRVEYLPITKSERPKSVRQYDFIYLGSVSEGTFGGKIPQEVSEYIKQCRGFENSKSGAFMLKRAIGFNNKGLKRLMGVLESAGSMVLDFQLVTANADVELLAKRLK
ncbi:hypothetical protein CSA56_07340 [candidate division KSB3 bacterium]|uniref:Flavodoxin-like domain-containing protein n=1 Tax=candidate division KSB3 bacterium TaxID=2044937 RepID=A0A2G6KFZ5_9BACT|nr:MAG: hypothetical protein CSA56_07340 [candidate division KSB3 bacterium]